MSSISVRVSRTVLIDTLKTKLTEAQEELNTLPQRAVEVSRQRYEAVVNLAHKIKDMSVSEICDHITKQSVSWGYNVEFTIKNAVPEKIDITDHTRRLQHKISEISRIVRVLEMSDDKTINTKQDSISDYL